MADPKIEVLYCPLCDELNKLEKAIYPLQKQIAELEHKRDRVTHIQDMRERLQRLQGLAKSSLIGCIIRLLKSLLLKEREVKSLNLEATPFRPKPSKQQLQEIKDLPGRIRKEELLLSQGGPFSPEDRWRLKREQQEVPPSLEKLRKLDRHIPDVQLVTY